MCKFKRFFVEDPLKFDENLRYIPDIERCFHKYFQYFQDDFSLYKTEPATSFIRSNTPFFWIILDFYENFMGFVFLDNFIGNDKNLFSAEISTCFDKKAWGSFTRYSAKLFLKKCFDEIGLYKIKAQVYPENYRSKKYLTDIGFKYESILKNETLRNGKLQDIEVYAIYRDYYYKK